MSFSRFRRFAPPMIAALAGVSLLLAACGSDNGDNGTTTPGTPSPDTRQTVTVQLDWTPNTNHIGIYVAEANGWYQEAGIDLEILPYGDNNPDTVVANNRADIGVSFPANMVYSRAAGLDLVAVAAVLQTNATEFKVLADSDIQSPRDFDGKTYAGFGLPHEAPQIRAVIQADGGEGDFEVATLSTFAYEALYNRQADFSDMFVAWEGIQAELRGVELRGFRAHDYGLPDYPSVVLVARAQAVESDADKLRTFLEVTRRGYEFAVNDPDEASRIFIEALPGAFPDEELILRSTRLLTDFFVTDGGAWGEHNPDDWQAYTDWLFENGLVVDNNDNVIEDPADLPGGPLFTNQLFP